MAEEATRKTPDLRALADQVQLAPADLAAPPAPAASEAAQSAADAPIEDEQEDEPEDDAGDASSPGTPGGGDAEDAEDEPEAGAFDWDTYVGGRPPADDDAFHKSLHADFTRKTQKLGAERARLEAERAALGEAGRITEALSRAGIDPRAFADAVQQQFGNGPAAPLAPPAPFSGAAPAQPFPPAPYAPPYAPAVDAGYAPPAAAVSVEQLYAADAEIAELSNAMVEAATVGEQVALQSALNARQREIARDHQQQLWQQQQQAAWRQQQQNTYRSTLTDELSRLTTDPRYAPLLRSPAHQAAVMQFAEQYGLTSAEQALHARFGPELVTIAQGLGQQKGRNGREKAKAASLARPQGNANPVAVTRDLVREKGESLSSLASRAVAIGAVKLQKPSG